MLEMLSYSDGNILSDVTLKIHEREALAVLCAKQEQREALVRALCGTACGMGGEILLDGTVLERANKALRKKIRAVPNTLRADKRMSAEEYLCFTAQAIGLDREKAYEQIKEAIELCALEECTRRIIDKLTLTERTRLSVAAALLGNPEYIVLDNPLEGVTGEPLEELYELFSVLARVKALVLLTPRPSDAQRLCESIAVMAGGKIALSGKIEDIMAKINATQELLLTARGDIEQIITALKAERGIVGVKLMASESNGIHSVSVEHTPDENIKDRLFAALAAINVPMLSYRQIKLTLDDVYYSLTKNDTEKNTEEGGREHESGI